MEPNLDLRWQLTPTFATAFWAIKKRFVGLDTVKKHHADSLHLDNASGLNGRWSWGVKYCSLFGEFFHLPVKCNFIDGLWFCLDRKKIQLSFCRFMAEPTRSTWILLWHWLQRAPSTCEEPHTYQRSHTPDAQCLWDLADQIKPLTLVLSKGCHGKEMPTTWLTGLM